MVLHAPGHRAQLAVDVAHNWDFRSSHLVWSFDAGQNHAATNLHPAIQTIQKPKYISYLEPKEGWVSSLFFYDDKTNLKKFQCRARIDDITAELNRRLGMPFYIPFISIIICYLLSSGKEKKYFFFRKYIIFIAAFATIVLAEIMVRYSGQSALNSIVYYSLPPLLILLNYLYLIRIFKFENLN